MATAADFNFGVPFDYIHYKCKIRSQGSKTKSRGYFLNLQTAVNNSATAKAREFKYGVRII